MIGTNFKKKREAAGLSQAELAEKLFVSRAMLAQVELGMKMPSVNVVVRACEIFNCSTDDLLLDGSVKHGGGDPERNAM